jgi:hypothetical protein
VIKRGVRIEEKSDKLGTIEKLVTAKQAKVALILR